MTVTVTYADLRSLLGDGLEVCAARDCVCVGRHLIDKTAAQVELCGLGRVHDRELVHEALQLGEHGQLVQQHVIDETASFQKGTLAEPYEERERERHTHSTL